MLGSVGDVVNQSASWAIASSSLDQSARLRFSSSSL